MKIFDDIPRDIRAPQPNGDDAWRRYRLMLFKATESVMESQPFCDTGFLDEKAHGL